MAAGRTTNPTTVGRSSDRPSTSTLDHMPTNHAYARFNKSVAVKVTDAVGSMTCGYIFSVIAFISPGHPQPVPGVPKHISVLLVNASLIALISWIAQT